MKDKPKGEPLEGETLEALRGLVSEKGARPLVEPLGVSASAIERAAAGGRVLRGTRALIVSGLAKMRQEGAL